MKKYSKPCIKSRKIKLNNFMSYSRMVDGADLLNSTSLIAGACTGTCGGTFICGASVASSGTGTCLCGP